MKQFVYARSVKKILVCSAVVVITALIPALFFQPVTVSKANAAAPPSIMIIVPYAPHDLEISIIPDNIRAERINRAYESYFTFYLHDMKSSEYTLRVATDEQYYDTVFTIKPDSYNNVYILDLDKGIFTTGIPASRAITLVSLRIVVTLVAEGIIFWIFSYRKKRSWIVFLVINLITQGILNIFLNTSGNPLSSYLIFILLFAEIWIVLFEMITFSIFINEQRRLITVFYVLCANILSLIVGGFLITVLPV